MKLLIPILLVYSLPVGQALALQIRNYSSARHDRFTGFSSAPVANASFMHGGVDLTGVGWDSTYVLRQFTLVSPRHFVGANHFRPPIGAAIRFVSADGTVRSSTVQSLSTIPNAGGQATDLLVGRLSTPFLPASGVRFLPCHLLDTEAAYIGQTLGVLGQPARGGRGIIAGFVDFGGDPITGGSGINTTRTMQFTYSNLTGSADDAYAESGDSGSPSFVVVNGRAAVAGTHTAVLNAAGTVTTFDTFLPAYLAQVNAVMEADGYHLTAAAPKTTTLMLTQQVTPAIPRAGYPVTIQFTLTNTGALFAANNVRLDTALTGAPVITPAGSSGWVFDAVAGGTQARRGGLGAGAGSQVSLSFTPAGAGTIPRTMTWSADEALPQSTGATITVLESFKSWSAGLADPSPGGDSDGDGVDNLMEYSQGGNPGKSSRTVDGSTALMGLAAAGALTGAEGNRQIVRFVRRTDAANRLLAYTLETSMTNSSPWNDVTTAAVILQVTPISPGLEIVEMALPATTSARQFARLIVTLSE